MKIILFSLVFSAMLIGAAAVSIPAQSTTASLEGTVVDQQQAVIANATVSIRNPNTGFLRNTQTDSDGRYKFVNLPTGSYEVTVESPNFSKYIQTGITLVVNQSAVVNAEL